MAWRATTIHHPPSTNQRRVALADSASASRAACGWKLLAVCTAGRGRQASGREFRRDCSNRYSSSGNVNLAFNSLGSISPATRSHKRESIAVSAAISDWVR